MISDNAEAATEIQNSAPQLDQIQEYAVAQAMSGRNVFLTGAGGTGKSWTLGHIVDELRDQGRRVKIAASTGIAALGVGGCTIHSLLGTGIASRVKEARKAAASTYATGRAAERFEHIDTVVVDEVSMLAGDYLDMMDWWLRRVLGSDEVFAGKQVVFLGDFLQLPPVEKDVVYDRKFGFQSAAWQRAEVEEVELVRSYRQSDQAMVDALNRIRRGVLDDESRALFAPCVGRRLEDPTRLCSTNRAARNENMRRLIAVLGREHCYEAVVEGRGKYAAQNAKRIVDNVIAEKSLRLKVGAPVILLRNDPAAGYVNGSRATVSECGERHVCVDLEGADHSVEVGRHTWEMRDGDAKVLATFRQFPMKLAWAITIHKSQGMSLDRVAVDLGSVFERGQAYVALSRARSLEGLSLDAPLEAGMVFAHPEIVEYYDGFERRSEEWAKRHGTSCSG